MNNQRQEQLSKIVIKGYKSIKECEIELSNINVLIGANGAGKSNLLTALDMLQRILIRELVFFAGKKGVETLFYNGMKETDSILAEFHFGDYVYSYEIEWTENETLLFREESFNFAGKEFLGEGGHRESNVLDTLRNVSADVNIPQIMLNPSWRIYQFHDTSPSSRIKSEHNICNDVFLINDARNLAAYLYRLKQVFPKEYSDILNAIRLVAPFFDDFVLEPRELNEEKIVLRWLKKDCADTFYASQLSDGTLRFICLATLLLQPLKLQPDIIIIDEPELGLHPFAITILAEMIQKAAVNKQVILATQSVELLDNFEVEDVVVVDSGENGSEFKRLDAESLNLWLENDYTLGELWNKNTFGGRS